MAKFFGDLHIHIGRTSKGKPVKITASPKLTLENICKVALEQKGLDLVGIVDAACSGVLEDLESLINSKRLEELSGGGCSFDGLIVFLGSEVELALRENGKEAHFLAYFPDLESTKRYAKAIEPWVTNSGLSTQRLRLSPDEWVEIVDKSEGVVVAAHAFTPHKGVYGNCVTKLSDMFKEPYKISGLELGLSADTEMALRISDTHNYPYLSNSDAHSLDRIAREFTTYELSTLDFHTWKTTLNTSIVSNHGLEPLLGKYYRSFCKKCGTLASQNGPLYVCPTCDVEMTRGVWDRIMEIEDATIHGVTRPPYIRHVPLFMLPSIGPRTYERMLKVLGTEIDILYNLPLEEINSQMGSQIMELVSAVRKGQLRIIPGGGGNYGKVTKSKKR